MQKVLDNASRPVCEREFMMLMNTLPMSVEDNKDPGKIESLRTAQKALDAAMQKAVSSQIRMRVSRLLYVYRGAEEPVFAGQPFHNR